MTKAKTGTSNGDTKPESSTPRTGQVEDGSDPDYSTDFSVAPTPLAESTTVAIPNLWLPVPDEATYYFFHNFASQDPRSNRSLNAYAHVLPPLYQQNSSFGVLPKIIDAIGLAGISNMKRSPDLMVSAGREYAKALRAINASIQDPRKAITDETLTAIMLLGLFEVLIAFTMSVSFYFNFYADRHVFNPRIYEIAGQSRQWRNYDSTPAGD